MKTHYYFKTLIIIFCSLFSRQLGAQSPGKITVTAYFFGGPEKVDSIPANKLTHIVFSFCHLKGNVLQVDNERGATAIAKLVELKKINSSLKVLLSLGGWGGCETCADVFSTEKGRKDFAQSVLQLNQFLKTDGIDIDWEYPVVEGYPGHKFGPSDKQNFTALIHQLRTTLGGKYEISFAAGGFQKFLEDAVDWKAVIGEVDRVNLMTYDLVNGNSSMTGHHTALYSNPDQRESTDNAVQYLLKLGVPANKLVIGAAFYGRMWENVSPTRDGLYQSGKFKKGMNFNTFKTEISSTNGWKMMWDDVTKAPYAYNADKKLFFTYDDRKSMDLKTKYAIDHKLNGIMFWEITNDTVSGGLLDAINTVASTYKKK
ncbi:MAG: glycoside hydrolase family 18 protein [Chryseolinea sp.]